MYTLFISTFDKYIQIGLLKDDQVISHEIHESINSHSIHTMPLIKDILEKNKLAPKDLNQIEVVNGPGSFTGVRIGITIAKTLSFTLNIPIKTISSLESLSLSTKGNKKLITLKDIKGVYYGLFDESNNLLEPLNYLNNKEFNEYVESHNYQNIIINPDYKLDVKRIHQFLKNKKAINSHQVNPLYIKKIEVEK